MPDIRHAYTPRPSGAIYHDPDEGRTKQAFVEECDINVIMRTWLKTGTVPSVPPGLSAQYGDFSNTLTYQESLNAVIYAAHKFRELPLDIRKKFNHNPDELLAFVDNPANRQESIDLGLLEGKKTLPVPIPTEPVETFKPAVTEPVTDDPEPV